MGWSSLRSCFSCMASIPGLLSWARDGRTVSPLGQHRWREDIRLDGQVLPNTFSDIVEHRGGSFTAVIPILGFIQKHSHAHLRFVGREKPNKRGKMFVASVNAPHYFLSG